MRYIVDIPPEMVDVILREIDRGEYRSVQEFIINSVQNQIYLTDNPIPNISVKKPLQQIEDAEKKKLKSVNYLVMEKGDIFTVNSNSKLLEPTLSGFWNKFLPTKITVRVLSNLLREYKESVPLALLQEQASLEARSIGLTLVKSERKSGRKRGDRLFTGLPVKRNSEKSRSRFKSHFVGSLKKNSIDGMAGTLHLLHIFRGEDGQDYVQLTDNGKEFSELENPILDLKNYNDSLSEKERDYLVQLIKKQLPKEFEEMALIIKLINIDKITTKDLIKELSTLRTEMSENKITTHLSGILNRLVDLNLLKRKYEGQSFIYEVTEKSKNIMLEG